MANSNIVFILLKLGQTQDPLEAVQYLEEIVGTNKDVTMPSGITITAVAHILKILYSTREHPNHAVAITKFILLCQNWLNTFKTNMKPNTGYRG